MDASEFKEYIFFGVLFLKRINDQFQADKAALKAKYEAEEVKASSHPRAAGESGQVRLFRSG